MDFCSVIVIGDCKVKPVPYAVFPILKLLVHVQNDIELPYDVPNITGPPDCGKLIVSV